MKENPFFLPASKPSLAETTTFLTISEKELEDELRASLKLTKNFSKPDIIPSTNKLVTDFSIDTNTTITKQPIRSNFDFTSTKFIEPKELEAKSAPTKYAQISSHVLRDDDRNRIDEKNESDDEENETKRTATSPGFGPEPPGYTSPIISTTPTTDKETGIFILERIIFLDDKDFKPPPFNKKKVFKGKKNQ